MKLPDKLHCPNCKGRLASLSSGALLCGDCERTVQIVDGIADFAGDSLAVEPESDRYGAGTTPIWPDDTDPWAGIQAAAGSRWPGFLGDTIELGCGNGDIAQAIATAQRFRTLLVCDTDIAMLRACQSRLASFGGDPGDPVAFATLGGARDALRDAVADTVIGTRVLSGLVHIPAFLAMVYRVLKPGGRAAFVVPNRRYHEAMCLAMAEALVHRRVREGAWPDGQAPVLEHLAFMRRLLIHRDNPRILSDSSEKRLFDGEPLQDMAEDAGFATVAMLPLYPDPAGAETMYRLCRDSGSPDSFARPFGAYAAAVGKSFFSLLSGRDSSASTVLWLTKAAGPDVRVFAHRPAPPVPDYVEPAVAIGGVEPRWSVELLARDTPDGIAVSVGGWCLCNADVSAVRLTLDGVTGDAPVWRPRPDVHDVLNGTGLYHPVNTLCSGLAAEILFPNAHAVDGSCPLKMEVILASGLVVTGPAPDRLAMNEPTVIAH